MYGICFQAIVLSLKKAAPDSLIINEEHLEVTYFSMFMKPHQEYFPKRNLIT